MHKGGAGACSATHLQEEVRVERGDRREREPPARRRVRLQVRARGLLGREGVSVQ